VCDGPYDQGVERRRPSIGSFFFGFDTRGSPAVFPHTSNAGYLQQLEHDADRLISGDSKRIVTQSIPLRAQQVDRARDLLLLLIQLMVAEV
jgi:hypothetical protein